MHWVFCWVLVFILFTLAKPANAGPTTSSQIAGTAFLAWGHHRSNKAWPESISEQHCVKADFLRTGMSLCENSCCSHPLHYSDDKAFSFFFSFLQVFLLSSMNDEWWDNSVNTHHNINQFGTFSLSGSAQESPKIFKTTPESFSSYNLNVQLGCVLAKINFSNRSDRWKVTEMFYYPIVTLYLVLGWPFKVHLGTYHA